MIRSNARFSLLCILIALPGEAAVADEARDSIQSVVDLFKQDAPLSVDQVPFTRTGDEIIPSRFFDNRSMRRVGFRMTSQVYRGITCEHDVEVYLPDVELSKETQGAAAIILGATFLGVKDVKMDWVEPLVLEMNVPCIVIKQGFDAPRFGAVGAGELMSFGNQTFFETGDPREAGYYALAKIFSAAASVAGQLPELAAKRFIVSGSSKGGMAALIACAGDPRIVGAFPTAWNAGNTLALTQLKGRRWGWDVKPKQTGPAGQSARESLPMLTSPGGQYYRQLFDPAKWGEALEGKFIMPAVGTNDHLFHLLADRDYFDGMNCRKAFLRVPNYGHGRTHLLHAAAWRCAVAASLLGREIPSVQLTRAEEGASAALYADIGETGEPLRLTLWQTTDADGDYRKADWTSDNTIELPAGTQRIRLKAISSPRKGTAAYFVQLEGASPGSYILNCSNIIEVGQPRDFPAPDQSAQ